MGMGNRTAEGRRARVEHRGPWGTTVLGRLDGCAPHHATLAPFAGRLLLEGRAGGELVLVDEASGAVLARRRVAPRRGRGAP